MSISVIIPVYNTPLTFFKECLESLTIQNLDAIEFIVVFDGDFPELIQQAKVFEHSDPRFKIFVQPHAGVSAARNLGINKAKGDYIAFVDADDFLSKDILQKAHSFAIEYSSDIVFWDCTTFNTKEQHHRQISSSNIPNITEEIKELAIRNTISTYDDNFLSVAGPWAKLYRKELLQNSSFNANLVLRQDRAFNLSLYMQNITISYLRENGYYYRVHENSAVRKFRENILQECFAYLKCADNITGNRYPQLIGLEAYQNLWFAWNTNILSEKNHSPFISRVKKFIGTIFNDEYNHFLFEIYEINNQPILTKIETKLIKHKISVTLWIRAIFWKLSQIQRH